jgi:hypothetical protein
MNDHPSTLGSHLTALNAFLGAQFSIPPHSEYRILDTTNPMLRWDPASRGVWTIKTSSLQTVEAFGPHFDQLLRDGYDWINLQALAIHEGVMIFVVDTPEEPSGVPPGNMRVNY